MKLHARLHIIMSRREKMSITSGSIVFFPVALYIIEIIMGNYKPWFVSVSINLIKVSEAPYFALSDSW